MGDRARKYKPTTIRRLDTLSGNQCYNPDCNNQLIGHDNTTIISKICHIEGASENGPRFNSNMDDDERRSFDNLILLCDECHSVIDNPANEDTYSVILLKEWKTQHENRQIYEHLKNPNLLRLAVNAISKISLKDIDGEDEKTIKKFKIQDKIRYNAIKRNKSLIEEYKIYYSKINLLYTELEKQSPFKKENLLRNIKNLYLKIKGKYVQDSENDIERLRENSDNIIEDIEEELFKIINTNTPDNFSFEISVIMVDAFMRCNIVCDINF